MLYSKNQTLFDAKFNKQKDDNLLCDETKTQFNLSKKSAHTNSLLYIQQHKA